MTNYKKYRKNKTVTKARALSRKSSKNQAHQILKLQKQITKINTKVSDNTKYCQFKYPLNMAIVGALAPSFGVWNLINPSAWEPIFQTKADPAMDITPSKFRGRSIGIELMAQMASPTAENPSPDPVTVTIFVVSLRKEVAKQFQYDTNNGTDLVEGVHYTKASMGTLQGEGMVMINKGIFKIRKVARFMIGGATDFYKTDIEGTPFSKTTNLKDNNRRIYWKLPYRNLLKDDGPDSTTTGLSGWKQLDINNVEATDQLYLLGFANSYADQAISVHANVVVTGTVAN